MKTTLLVILLCVLQIAATDDSPTGREEEALKQATDRFMAKMADKQLAEAISDLTDRYWYDRSELAKTKAATIAQFAPELAKAENKMGPPLPNGYEFLGTKRIGKSTVRLVYLQKYANFILPWSFTFYKAKDKFKLVNVDFGDSVADDLKTFTVTEPAR